MSILIPDDLIKAKRSKLMVVMMGAGISAAANMPTWKELLEHLARYAAEYNGLSLEEIKKSFKDERPEAVASRIASLFPDSRDLGKALTDILEVGQKKLDDLPKRFKDLANLKEEIHGVLTTNFDDLVEVTFNVEADGVLYRSTPNLRNTLRDLSWFLFKIHGDGQHQRDLVLTLEQYDALRNDNKYIEIMKWLIAHFIFLFVGYSLSDEYLTDLLADVSKENLGQNWAYAILPSSLLKDNEEKVRILESTGIRFLTFEDSKGYGALDSFLSVLAAKTGVPDPVTDFVGRKGIIERMINQLRWNLGDSGSGVMILTGTGGVGKTELARAFAKSVLTDEILAKRFGCAIQVDLIGSYGSDRLFTTLRRGLDLPASAQENDILSAIVEKRAFILLDNLEDPFSLGGENAIEEFTRLLRRLAETAQKGGFILGTCRPHQKVDEFNIQIYDVSELTENEAKELFFLVSKLNEEDPKILKIADKILNTIGRHPLNVRLAAMYCQSEKIASSYVENYHKVDINFETLTTTVANVMRTFKMAMDTITSDAKTAAAVVSAFSSGVPPRLLTSILGDEWPRSIFETIRYGLVFNSAGRYRMLEPLRQSLIALNDQSLDEMRRKAMNKSILYYSDELEKYQRQRDIGKTLASNAWALYDETGNLVDAFNWADNQQHEKLFDMLYNSYDYTSWAGPIFDKREWVTTAFDLLEKKSSKGSIELEEHARYQLMFARILDRYGDPVSWTNAIEYYIKTEELFRRILQQKPKDPNIRESLAFVKSTLACLLTWTGGNENLKRAVNELEEAIQICRELVAENQSAISNLSLFLNNFGWILNTMGGSQTYLRGINVLKEALEIRKELAQQRADMDWWLGRTELNLGTVLDSYGSPEGAAEAEELFKQAIKRYRRLWSYTPGAALPLAMALVYSGLMYWRKNTRKGRNTAFSHFTEALDIYRKWAEGNPGARYEVAWAARFLGNLYRTGIDGLPTIEQLQDALALLDEAISIYESVIAHRPGGKTDAAITKADKALVLAALGQEQEALQILEEVQPEFEEDSKQRQCALLNLAELRHQMAEILRRQTTPRSFETRNTYMKKLKNTWYLVQRLVKQSPSSSSEDISADHTPIQADSISKTILEHYKAAFDLSRVQAEEFPGAVSCFFDIAKDYASYLREIGRAEEAGNVESSLQKFGRDKKFIKNYGRLEFKGLSGK